jgi:hypothetical protein
MLIVNGLIRYSGVMKACCSVAQIEVPSNVMPVGSVRPSSVPTMVHPPSEAKTGEEKRNIIRDSNARARFI